jgi:hypothetical protein
LGPKKEEARLRPKLVRQYSSQMRLDAFLEKLKEDVGTAGEAKEEEKEDKECKKDEGEVDYGLPRSR